MALKVQHTFEVNAPIDQVWTYFADPEQVVPCLPGAELLDVLDQQTYRGRVGIRLGQINMNLEGQVQIVAMDEAQKTMILTAGGDQLGAPGGAQADISFSLHELNQTQTAVNIAGDVQVSGRLARMGGGMVQTVAKYMFDRFSKCTADTLQVPLIEAPARPADGFFRRAWTAARDWIRKVLGFESNS
ncbi:MAG: SRPBCC family protein [Candidatus Promineifilaceae bacterium]|nr:SRPBCC family protein [Candidatus Promineifilaceae bacterium]